MEVFEHAVVVVSNGERVFLLNQVDVVESRVTDVVTSSCQHIAHHVPFVQTALKFQVTLVANEKEGLGQICGVRLVVVRNVLV